MSSIYSQSPAGYNLTTTSSPVAYPGGMGDPMDFFRKLVAMKQHSQPSGSGWGGNSEEDQLRSMQIAAQRNALVNRNNGAHEGIDAPADFGDAAFTTMAGGGPNTTSGWSPTTQQRAPGAAFAGYGPRGTVVNPTGSAFVGGPSQQTSAGDDIDFSQREQERRRRALIASGFESPSQAQTSSGGFF